VLYFVFQLPLYW